MTRELTPLEALERIEKAIIELYINKNIPHPECPDTEKYVNKSWHFDIIETALKENEELKTSYLNNLLNEKSKEYIYKKLKALEIIKKHFKGLLKIDYDEEHEFYEIWVENEYKDVFVIASGQGKEEYDLLKECFNNEH